MPLDSETNLLTVFFLLVGDGSKRVLSVHFSKDFDVGDNTFTSISF